MRFPPNLLRAGFRAAVSCLLVAGCVEPSTRSRVSEALDQVSFEAPPSPPVADALQEPVGTAGDAASAGPRPSAQIYRGRGVARRPQAGVVQRSAEGVQLNFDQAEIRDVVKVILGDILGVSYTVDPEVQGQVTLSTSAPMAEQDLLAVLETVLRANGASLVDTGAGAYRVMSADAAIGRSEVLPLGGQPIQVRPGYGITIVPLRSISATSAAQFIQPLVASPEDIRIDPGRNAILFSGTAAERQNVVETLADLDVDWMADKSIGLFPLERANAEAIIPELQAIFAPFDPTGAEPALIRFLPLARMNAVLAIAGDPGQIEEVADWVSRLDYGQAVGSQFYVHYLKHAAAEEVAKLLNEAFSEGPASEPGPTLGSGSAALGGAPPVLQEEDTGEFAVAEDGGQQPFGGAAEPPPTASGPVKVVASKANNALLIRATPAEYQRVEATLLRLDTAPWQVLIEATIAEVVLTDQLRYGVQYFLESGSFAGSFVSGGTSLLPSPVIPGFNFLFTPGGSNITIDALSRLTDVRVLSAPSVVVQDNSEAVLTVGDEVPVTTRSAVSVIDPDAPVVNSIEYRDTGVILQVRPRINSNAVVSLEIAQEVSRVPNPESLTPTITQRKITSRVNVQSGQTVVLGGLIQDSESRGRDRIPVLGEIPVVGNLFGTTNNNNVRSELIVFITPRVFRNPEDARDVSEELRSRLKSLRPTPFARAAPLGPSVPPPVPNVAPPRVAPPPPRPPQRLLPPAVLPRVPQAGAPPGPPAVAGG
ncbi:MAG TPA: type II secretion system secretin GspD [Geminicoccaceae bacterium]|nr:type II secretion system secretin GspD [Geminicoccaceae bacterium]